MADAGRQRAYCDQCGRPAPKGAKFCGWCGSPLGPLQGRVTLLADQAALGLPPPRFRRARRLLEESLRLSLEDNFAIRRWIVAYHERDPGAREPLAAHERASLSASRAKERFFREYNVRPRELGLPSPPSSFRY